MFGQLQREMSPGMRHTDIFSRIGLITQLGLGIAVPTVGGAWLGGYLRRRFGTSGTITLILILIGVISGLLNVYHILKKDMDKGR